MFGKIINYFRKQKTLIGINEELIYALEYEKSINLSLNETLRYNMWQYEVLRKDALRTLGAIAMQYNGEFCVKTEFLKMMSESTANFVVRIQHDDNKGGSVIKVIEDNDEKK